MVRSHDGFHEGPDGELIPDNAKYATQQKVFNDLGNDVLTSAYDGYNSTLVRKSDRHNERFHPLLAMWPLRLRSSLFFFFFALRLLSPSLSLRTVRLVPARVSPWSATA